jgi:predicted dehydrogenase
VLRFGLIGSGWWADEVHARALADCPDAQLAAVWGRDPAKAGRVAQRWGAEVAADPDELIDGVDALTFAVPPDVQAPIATRAASAGRHLLLEKPTARDPDVAAELARTAAAAGAASMVFFTWRHDPGVADWLAEVAGAGPVGAEAHWVGSIFTDDSPFDTPWRREPGAALWDVGPHALSVVVPVLGPVTAVDGALADAFGTVRVLLRHDGGGSSALTLSLSAPPDATTTQVRVMTADGWSSAPEPRLGSAQLLGRAIGQLAAIVRDGASAHPLDAAFGAQVVGVLAEAEALLDLSRP